MLLNYRLLTPSQTHYHTPVVLIHGLFGSLDNLGLLAKPLSSDRCTIQLDMRNHGLSPRAEVMTYSAMAQDVLDTLKELQIDEFAVIGHSMGGKIAMALTALAPEKLRKVVIIDIAPVNYTQRRHDAIFSALHAVDSAGITSRRDAACILGQFIPDDSVNQFLLKSFHQGEWRFNVPALEQNYLRITGWEPVSPWYGPTLFIRGEQSDYLDEQYRDDLLSQFPAARAWQVAGAAHWVHAEKPDTVMRIITRFFADAPSLV